MNKRIFAATLTLLLVSFLLPLSIYSNPRNTLLIINSLSETDQWTIEMVQPVILYAAEDKNTRCEMYDLNAILLTDSIGFQTVASNIIAEHIDNPPTAVIMIGDLAFNMREMIKKHWGNVPMTLLTNNRDFTPLNKYFDGTDKSYEADPYHMLVREQKKYNFSAIIVPDFYGPTVDMMVSLMPQMEHLVLLSDSVPANRDLAYGLHCYVREQYPNLSFTWLKANQQTADSLRNYIVNYDPKAGLLLSSWQYSKSSSSGIKIPTSNELKLISASRTPIFSLRESYIPAGVVGGVYADMKLALRRETALIDSMLAGCNMQKIPFYVCDESYPCINYRLLTEYGMKESNCPSGTVFYSKPPTFWEKHLWHTLIFVVIILIIFAFMGRNIANQRKKIAVLNRNKEFVNVMPIPYSTANVRYDTEGNVVTIDYAVKNEAFAEIIERNKIPGSPFLLFPASFIGPKVAQLLKDQKLQTFVYHFEKTDTYYQFIICLVSMLGKHKNTHQRQIDIFAIDITERHKMESQLMSTKRKLDITLNVSNLIPWQYNPKSDEVKYDQYDRTTEFKSKMDIHTSEQCISYSDFIKLIHPEDRHLLMELRDNVRQGIASDINLKYRRMRDDNPLLYDWCELLCTVTEIDAEGHPTMVTGSIEIITNRIEQQQKMATALEHAKESDRMKSAFLATISHEIRTPLNAIVGFSNVIAHTKDEKERLEFCDMISKNNDQLLTLINDVLDLAKIESNTIDIDYEECDINVMMDHVESTMLLKAPEGVIFRCLKSEEDCIAELDRHRVQQILTNLISNACKFTKEGNITFGYEITDNEMLYFYVRDSGIGIPKDQQKKIFERFVKLDSFVPGTGLGLSICKMLVEKMGGEIGVESAGHGKGSLFWFSIPYIPAKNNPLTAPDGQFMKSWGLGVLARTDGRKIKVLIAEDNESNYRLLAHMLSNNFDIVRAHDGAEAVDKFINEVPDIVLMDISMPEMDGYEAFDKIRLISKVPIVAVTANVYASDRTNILNHGFNGFVSKPITQKAIIDAIGHALMNQG